MFPWRMPFQGGVAGLGRGDGEAVLLLLEDGTRQL